MKLFIAMTTDNKTIIVHAETLKDFYSKTNEKDIRVRSVSEVTKDIIFVQAEVCITIYDHNT